MKSRPLKKITTAKRKDDHIRINLEADVEFRGVTTGLERLQFEHQALPELDLARIDTSVTVFGKVLRAPLMVSSMTGGTRNAQRINRVLATAAGQAGIAMGLGSMRVALESQASAASFDLRKYAPDLLLFANLGAPQLNYGYGIEHCRRAVALAGADGLILHFNPLQEAVQPEGAPAGRGRRGPVPWRRPRLPRGNSPRRPPRPGSRPPAWPGCCLCRGR